MKKDPLNEYAANVFLADDIPKLILFGTGHRVLYVTEGDKWVRLRDASGNRTARITVDQWDDYCDILKPNERKPGDNFNRPPTDPRKVTSSPPQRKGTTKPAVKASAKMSLKKAA